MSSSCDANDTGSLEFNVSTIVVVPTELNPAYATLELICAVLSIVGNSVVIFLFIKKHSLRTVKNCYVISLAVADLLVGLMGIPSALAVSVGLPTNFHACMIMTSILMLLCTGSIMSLVAVTIDRFWSIMNPLTYPATMTHTKARVTIFVCWCLSTVIGLLPLFGWHRRLQPPQPPRCFFVEVMDPAYLVFIYFATIVAPSIFMGAIYAVIFFKVRRRSQKLLKMIASSDKYQHHQQQQQQQQSSQPQDPRQNERLLQQFKVKAKTVKIIFIIVVVFLISWFPLYTLNTIAFFCPGCCISKDLFKASILLSHFNSVWNPILYSWKMKDFHVAIKELVLGPRFKSGEFGRSWSNTNSTKLSSMRVDFARIKTVAGNPMQRDLL